MVDLLYSVLVAGAGLAASGAVGEFAKQGGKAAFEALKARLSERHGAASVALAEQAAENPAYESAIKADLAKPEIAEDAELRRLADQLRETIRALPPAETSALPAVMIETIESGGSLTIEDNEGVAARSATSQGDMTIRGNRSPGK